MPKTAKIWSVFELEAQCWRQSNDFEGVKNPEVKFSQNKTKGSQGKKMTYNAQLVSV